MKLADDNRQVYSGAEFDRWAHRTDFELGEEFLLKKYLDPELRTFEAGCGGGRLLLQLQSCGFTDLHGFDYLPEFIEVARRRDKHNSINYSVQNAISLDYDSESFDQALYLQHVLCFLESAEDRRRAVREAFRVLRPGGLLIASLLAFRSRAESWIYKPCMVYLQFLRRLMGRDISMQHWPWLRQGNSFNFGVFLDQGPYTYWFESSDAASLFEDTGFKIVGIGSDAQIEKGYLPDSPEMMEQEAVGGALYLVCQKPLAPGV